MMHQTIDRCGCGHGVIPLTENEVAADHETASFVALGQKGEQNFHLFGLFGCVFFCNMAMLTIPSKEVTTYLKNLAHEFMY